MVLKKELIAVGESYSSREEALLTIARRFVSAGYAKGSYPQAIIERERVFPTGLPAEAFDIAISHCDSEHVLESAIGVSVLDKPVEFCMMGNLSDEPLHPLIIFYARDQGPEVPGAYASKDDGGYPEQATTRAITGCDERGGGV